ncbi:hypothetical protein THAOC_28091, partial [Thalassiosira oceanica]
GAASVRYRPRPPPAHSTEATAPARPSPRRELWRRSRASGESTLGIWGRSGWCPRVPSTTRHAGAWPLSAAATAGTASTGASTTSLRTETSELTMDASSRLGPVPSSSGSDEAGRQAGGGGSGDVGRALGDGLRGTSRASTPCLVCVNLDGYYDDFRNMLLNKAAKALRGHGPIGGDPGWGRTRATDRRGSQRRGGRGLHGAARFKPVEAGQRLGSDVLKCAGGFQGLSR